MGDIGMHRLGILQDRIEKRLGVSQQTISDHLPKMPALANPVNSDLSRGFTVAQVAEKHKGQKGLWHGLWPLKRKKDLERFKDFGWRLRLSQ